MNDSGAAATQMKEDLEDDEDEDVLLRIPRSFRSKNYGGAREAGAGAVNSVEAVGREEFVLTRNSKDANNRLFSIPNVRTHDSP